MSRRPRPLPPDDDGRTIAPMNVDGMPWYTEGFDPPPGDAPPAEERPPLSKEDRHVYMFAALRASLFIWLVFAVVFAAFIAFCYFFWFR